MHSSLEILDLIRSQLKQKASDTVANASQKFFKEEIQTYGVPAPIVQSLARSIGKSLSLLPKTEVFAICEELWTSGIQEECLVACHWSLSQKSVFEESDFETFERWIVLYVHNWATCDTFCNHTVGEFLFRYPSFTSRMLKWAKHPNRWARRAAAVSLILPARQGMFIEIIQEVSLQLLDDQDDLVQKGYGWMLKVACRHHEKTIFDFVMEHKNQMPRTALRYAVENMPRSLKNMAMAR